MPACFGAVRNALAACRVLPAAGAAECCHPRCRYCRSAVAEGHSCCCLLVRLSIVVFADIVPPLHGLGRLWASHPQDKARHEGHLFRRWVSCWPSLWPHVVVVAWSTSARSSVARQGHSAFCGPPMLPTCSAWLAAVLLPCSPSCSPTGADMTSLATPCAPLHRRHHAATDRHQPVLAPARPAEASPADPARLCCSGT